MNNEKQAAKWELKLTWQGKLWYWAHKLTMRKKCDIPAKWSRLVPHVPKLEA